MPNGRPGDHPLTDMLVYKMHPFPEDMEKMLLEILEIDSNFPDGKRYYVEQVEWVNRFFDWEKVVISKKDGMHLRKFYKN